MANELLPHYHARMPQAAEGTVGYLDQSGGVAHAYASRFPSLVSNVPEGLTPEGGVILASGASEVSGGEGLLTPYGAGEHANAAAMETASVVADPATDWDSGSFVTCDDGTFAHFNTAAWVAGKAP